MLLTIPTAITAIVPITHPSIPHSVRPPPPADSVPSVSSCKNFFSDRFAPLRFNPFVRFAPTRHPLLLSIPILSLRLPATHYSLPATFRPPCPRSIPTVRLAPDTPGRTRHVHPPAEPRRLADGAHALSKPRGRTAPFTQPAYCLRRARVSQPAIQPSFQRRCAERSRTRWP